MSKTRRITKKLVEGLPAGSVVWDSDVIGFGVRKQRRYATFVLKYRAAGGRQRWVTIGRVDGYWTPDLARAEAKRMLGLIASGEDPALHRDRSKDQVTVEALAARYLTEHAREFKKPRSAKDDERILHVHILPTLGRRHVSEIEMTDIAALARAIKGGKTGGQGGGPIASNRAISLISKMFSLAEEWGLRPLNTNPARGIKRYKENAKERFLTGDELTRLFAALRQFDEAVPYATAAIRLLLATGARKSEITGLQWSMVDLERGVLSLEDTKTGSKSIILSPVARQILAELPRSGDGLVIAGRIPGRPATLDKVWRRIRKAADLDGVRLHDLRHSYASLAAASGTSLQMIGKLLGHRDVATTSRYAHLTDAAAAAATEAVGRRLAALDGPGDGSAEVVPIRRQNSE